MSFFNRKLSQVYQSITQNNCEPDIAQWAVFDLLPGCLHSTSSTNRHVWWVGWCADIVDSTSPSCRSPCNVQPTAIDVSEASAVVAVADAVAVDAVVAAVAAAFVAVAAAAAAAAHGAVFPILAEQSRPASSFHAAPSSPPTDW